MADLFKALKPEKHLSKSGFDLSQKHVFSMKAGQLVPCLAVETVPDDYFEIDLASLVRTQTLNTAAFLRGKIRYDFFFVPNSQLWHMFNQFITQRKDKHSTLSKGAKFCPNVQLSAILNMIYSDDTSTDIHFIKWKYNAVRLLDMLGYGNHSCLLNPDISDEKKETYIANHNEYVNIFRLAAYQHIWYDFYRNKYYDTGDSGEASSVDVGDYVSYFNFDDIDCSSVANSHIPVSTSDDKARVRGLLGQRYVQWKKDLFTSSLPGQQFGVVSAIDMTLPTISVSLSGDGSKIGELNENATTDNANHWKSQYGLGPNDNYAVSLHVAGSGDSKYSQLYAVDMRGEATQDFANRLQHQHTIVNRGVNSVEGSVGITGAASYSSDSVSFDVLQLYKAQMLQNWKQATLRAGNMTDDNFRAHFGVTPRYEGDENVDFLGSYDGSLQINAVEATATTGETINGKVGELGATGTAVAQGTKIRYKARDFGIIMCVASFLPESEYNANMLDKANTLLEEFDYFTPEFENIGLEAIPAYLYDNNMENKTDILGYAPRYFMYKTAVDKVHGEFATTIFADSVNPNLGFTEQGSLVPWVAPRTEQFAGMSAAYRTLSTFYVTPSVFDSVIGVNATGSQSTDYLLSNTFFDIKAIRPMSVLGLPQF